MIREELERIRLQNGGILRPEDVVKEAKSPSSPLHPKFNWDDSSAAHAWRLEQARHLIRVFVNVVKVGNGEKESRMFVALSSDKADGGGYRVLTEVLDDAGMRRVLLNDALEDLERFEKKYRAIKELAEVFAAAKRVRKSRQVEAVA